MVVHFSGTTGCNFVNDPEHGDSPESARAVQQSKLEQHCNTDDQRQNNSRMDNWTRYTCFFLAGVGFVRGRLVDQKITQVL